MSRVSDSSTSAEVAPRLSIGRRFGYGSGDFGFGLMFMTASHFLLLFYTDYMGLDPSIAGWVFGAAIVWDAIIDPVMGGLANRTHSKWGRYRPYLLWAAVPLAVAWALMFMPTGFTGPALVVYALGMHLLFRTVYTVAWMPYLALSAAITENSQERSALAAFRLIGQALAGVLAAFVTIPLVNRFGGGQEGFFYVASLYGVGTAIFSIICFASCREITAGDALKVRPSFPEMIGMLKRNSAFWLACGAFLLFAVATVFFNKSLPYIMKYGLEREPGPALGIYGLTLTVGFVFWGMIAKRMGKRTMFFIGAVMVMLVYIGLWVAPLDIRAWLPLVAFLGLGSGALFLSTWAIIPDTVEFGEWVTGVRAEGAVFGFVSFVQKSSLGLAAGLLGEVLALIGYTANVEQTPETLAGLKLVMLAVPALFLTIATVSIYFYPLDKGRHSRLVRALQWRRKRQNKTPSEPPPLSV